MRFDAEKIYTGAIRASLPDAAVRTALSDLEPPKGRLVLVAIGKAAYRMTSSALAVLHERGIAPSSGIVITKYRHAEGSLPNIEIYEAGHPVPDENGIFATERALEMTCALNSDDLVLFLVSGGGSALFESPKCTLGEMQGITTALLESGADISEINTVRKHLSRVKGGRFAEHVSPARVTVVALSDVIGSDLGVIASGPCTPDESTSAQAISILEKYGIEASDKIKALLSEETPKRLSGVSHFVGGSVSGLCEAARLEAEKLGYNAAIITDSECGIAREVGERLSALAREKVDTATPLAYIIGGETVVRVRGNGLGGRNQELTLSAALGIDGLSGVSIFSVGSDGTDGPTDAAGGYADGDSVGKMCAAGLDPLAMLENNDSYHALSASGGLVITGPTGTNVNDVAVLLIKPRK